jgi:methyl-accepting chemotaxis protein
MKRKSGPTSRMIWEIIETMDDIASSSQQNSAAAQEVSSSSEGMRKQMERVKVSAESLSDLAGSLQQAVAQFSLN